MFIFIVIRLVDYGVMTMNKELEFAKWCIQMAECHGGKEYFRVAEEARIRFPELKDYKPGSGPA